MKKYLLFLLVVAFIGERQVYPQESSATKTLTFKNYSISYPADLRLAKKTESGNFMLLVTPKEDISMVIIDLSQYPYDVPLKDYAESAIEQLKEEHFTTVLENKATTINNLPCWRFICAFDDGNGELQAKSMYHIWIKNKWAYVLILNSEPTNFDKQKLIVQKIAGTFKYTH